jgi:hypothetical protein
MPKKVNNFHKEKKIVKENEFFGKYFELSFFKKINYLTHMCLSHQGVMVVSNQSPTTLK